MCLPLVNSVHKITNKDTFRDAFVILINLGTIVTPHKAMELVHHVVRLLFSSQTCKKIKLFAS